MSEFTPFPNEVYTTFSFFGLIMCVIPLPWHLKAWNVGTCLFMFWAGMGCLVFSVNSIVWHGNVFNVAPTWCDICVKIVIGTFTGIPASSLCINRRLYLLQLDPAGNFAITKSDKIRSIGIDLGISLGLPIILMILHHVYQAHRFDIFENLGCIPSYYNTWVSILLLNVPPIFVGLASAIYGICAIISINERHIQLNELLAHRLNITSSLYFRLLCFAGMEALTTTPIAIYFIVVNLTVVQLYPWISWENSHLDVHRVGQYPAIQWHNFPFARAYELARWIHVISAIIFFSNFGFAEEAKSHYHLTINFFLRLTGIRGGRQTEFLDFQNGPRSSMSQSDSAGCVTFANQRPPFPDYGRSGGEPAPRGMQDHAGDHLGSQTGPHSPGNSLKATIARVPAAVEQENERTPSIRNTRNLRSFLNLGHNSSTQLSFAHSPQMDISAIEEGQPSEVNRSRSSRPFRSFLNLN